MHLTHRVWRGHVTLIGMSLYALYILWLVSGFLDFACHRRTDLPHTSGLRESSLHGVQLLLIGTSVLLWLIFEATWALAAAGAALASVHAVFGYLDTVSADGRRRITPFEQHVHSVLDAMPWVFLAIVFWNADPEWNWRVAPREGWTWIAVLAPALILVIFPWLRELAAALRASPRTL